MENLTDNIHILIIIIFIYGFYSLNKVLKENKIELERGNYKALKEDSLIITAEQSKALFKAQEEFRIENENKENYFNNYKLPEYIINRFKFEYPQYVAHNEEKIQLIEQSLMDYFSLFLNRNNVKNTFYNFPSKVADDLWHTFLLFTKEYNEFCMNSFGRIIDHEPHTSEEPNKASFFNLLNTYVKLKELNKITILNLDSMFGVENKFNFNYLQKISAEYNKLKSIKFETHGFSNESKKRSFASIDITLLLSVGLITSIEFEEINNLANEHLIDLFSNNKYNSIVSTPEKKEETSSYCGSTGYISSCGSSTSSSCGSAGCGAGCGGA